MKKIICEKCNQKFKSVYLLEKHKNKQIPCDTLIKFQCINCHKALASKQSLERHLNKKIPCNKLKNRQENFSNEILTFHQKKELLILEKNLEKEILEKKLEMEKKFQIEKEIEILEKKMEIQERLHRQRMEIEDAKLARKEKTAKVINNTINNIVINAPTINVIPADKEKCINNIIKPMIEKLTANTINTLIYGGTNITDIPTKILEYFYNNSKFPENKNMLFLKEKEMFFVVLEDEWVQKKYEYIDPIIMRTFKEFFNKVKEYIEEPDINSKYYNIYTNINTYCKNLNLLEKNSKKYAKLALEHDSNNLTLNLVERDKTNDNIDNLIELWELDGT